MVTSRTTSLRLCILKQQTWKLWHIVCSSTSLSEKSVGSDNTSQHSLLTCISEAWPAMTLSLFHHCSFLLCEQNPHLLPNIFHPQWRDIQCHSLHLSVIIILGLIMYTPALNTTTIIKTANGELSFKGLCSLTSADVQRWDTVSQCSKAALATPH